MICQAWFRGPEEMRKTLTSGVFQLACFLSLQIKTKEHPCDFIANK